MSGNLCGLLVVETEPIENTWVARKLPRESERWRLIESDNRKYSGFDGVQWPNLNDVIAENLENGLAALESLDNVITHYQTENDLKYSRLIYIEKMGVREAISLPKFKFVGLDVGVFDYDGMVFSIIYNEVIFGVTDLQRFREKLNEYKLVDSINVVKNLLDEREIIEKNGGDLEEFDLMDDIGFYNIFLYE